MVCNSYNWAYREYATDTDLLNARTYIIFNYWYENLEMLALRKQSKKIQQHGYDHLNDWLKSYKTKLRLTFIKPMHIPTGACHKSKSKHKTMDFHFWVSNGIVRRFKRGGSQGYHLHEDIYANIASWEVIVVDDSMSFEEFKKKFDMRFITEKELKLTWNNKSPQHGGAYKKTDFKSMSKRGKDLLDTFLTWFDSVTIPTEHYETGQFPTTSTKDLLREHYTPWGGRRGRTISIEHHYPRPYVVYSTEDVQGGREKCCLIANKNEVLHLEND